MCNQFLHKIWIFAAAVVCPNLHAEVYLSARPGAVRSTNGEGAMFGINFENLSEVPFGIVSELNYRDAKSENYQRSDMQAVLGADMKFSPYVSIVSSFVFQLSQSKIENDYSIIQSTTHSIGLANGLSSRWIFGDNFYFAMDWLSVFTPLNTVQTEFSMTEKLRIYASEQRRIENSFFRTEILGNGTFLSPRVGWKF